MKKETKCQCGGKRAKLWHLVCEDCWKQLPAELQSELYHAYKTNPGSEKHCAATRKVFEFLKTGKAVKQIREEFPIGKNVTIVEEGTSDVAGAAKFARNLISNEEVA